MANINKFYNNKYIKYLLIIFIILIIFMKTYYKNKDSIKIQKEVLMYSKEYDIIENIENDAIKKEAERQKKADTHIYKSSTEKKAEQIKRYREARKKADEQKIIEYKEKINNVAVQEIKKQKNLIKEKFSNKNYKEINTKYYNALAEIKNTLKNFPNKNANKKIKRGDVVYATIKVNLESNEYLKKALTDTSVSNEFYKQLEKQNISKDFIKQIKNINLMEPKDLLFKVGFKSNFYDQLIDKKVGDTLIVSYEDYATNTQTQLLKEEKIKFLKRVELLKRHAPEYVDIVKDFYDKLAFNYEVKILDIVDNNVQNKFNLDTVLEENFDKIDEEVKANLEYENEINEKLKKINLE